MNRRAIALRLAALIALSGLLPIGLLAAAALETLSRRGEQASTDALQAIAVQAGARLDTWLLQQREMLRALAMALGTEADAERRLADVVLDAPSLGRVRLIGPETPASLLPGALRPEQIVRALSGTEVSSDTYIAELSPAMDVCVPAGRPGRAVCATLDLLELQRQVQRIRAGASGYAIAFDRSGRLVAAGLGTLRASVLSGDPVSESQAALELAKTGSGPRRLLSSAGIEVLAGWAQLPDVGWTIAIEEPVEEALRGAREAIALLWAGVALALLVSVLLGVSQVRKVLASLVVEERWHTAGLIAAGITHDLGHRLAILQQTSALAEMNDAAFLPRIRESLASEVATLRKFVADFADLTRVAEPDDFMPLELNAFAESVCGSARSHAALSQITLEVKPLPGELRVMGDRYLLERALLNLFWNAIEASPPGARVTITVREDETRATLAVEDHGSGIEASRLPTLFDSFHSTKRTGAHVGVGLPNVRRILRAHGGDVSVKSTVGRGSVFTLHMPRKEESAPA